jgi:hypothetical protein
MVELLTLIKMKRVTKGFGLWSTLSKVFGFREGFLYEGKVTEGSSQEGDRVSL